MSKINSEQTSNKDKLKYVDPSGEKLFEAWIEMDAFKYILLQEDNQQVFNCNEFVSLLKTTVEYFQQLNTSNSLPLYSQDSISFSSCLRIIDIMYQYACNKVFVSDCDYEDFEDLDNYPLAKLQISLKTSQLIAQSLCFAVSIIPKEKLGSVFGVIYNSKTIDYNAERGNLEDIMKEVCECPHSEY